MTRVLVRGAGIRDRTEGPGDSVAWREWIEVCGLRVARIGRAEASRWLRQAVRSGHRHLVVTLDASGVVVAQDDEEYREIVNTADLVTPDSTGILWASSRLGAPLAERVCGIDLVDELSAICADLGRSMFLLGGEPGVADEAARALTAKHPGLAVSGTYHGFFAPDEDAALAEMVRSSGAHVLLIGMGIPKQEKWARRYLRQVGASVVMGVGGSFDVISGRRRRAPLWLREHGLEWLWRLGSDPRKLGKNLMLPRFVSLVRASVRDTRRTPGGLNG